MSRQPYATESPDALLRHLFSYPNRRFWQEGTSEGATMVVNTYNDATAPDVYRSDDEHAACKRIAFLCRRIRATRYGSRSIQETADGVWFKPAR
jgi:hypothetical protein